MTLDLRDFEEHDHDWADDLIGSHQGGSRMVARLGELLDPLTLPGIVAEVQGRAVGLLTVNETESGLEALTVHAAERGIGVGTRLLETALRVAAASESPRLWLITTNDNLAAIRFYLRRGMTVAKVHERAFERDIEALKPEMPRSNTENGIPYRDYVELELPTDAGDTLRFLRFPRIEDIDALPPEAAADALGPLFEHGPRFVARLVEQRPFDDDATLIARAHDLARTLPEDEQVELLNAHPRIGADPATMSALSHAEQGHDDEVAQPATWIGAELEALNETYERIFGFRFVVFVAGRPRTAILPILESSLRDDRAAELRRGLDDVVHIAADRLATLRSGA